MSDGPYGRHGFNANPGYSAPSYGGSAGSGYSAPSYGQSYGGASYAAPASQDGGYGSSYGAYGGTDSYQVGFGYLSFVGTTEGGTWSLTKLSLTANG